VIASGPTKANPTITLRHLSQDAVTVDSAQTIAVWDADPSAQLRSLHCFADSRTITLVLANGDIITVRQEPLPGEEQIEIVGSVDAGILVASWSPDDELLAIATNAGTLLVMTRDFELTANVTLAADDVEVSDHVSVGWGKKETQFKGRGAAKTLRDPTMPEHVDEGKLSPLDDGRVALSWRGDGQYFAMNSILEGASRRRLVRVYSREGVLESVSEPVDGLEGALSWKPSGQVLAGIQRLDDRLKVVFFERNGLRHGEFDLRLSKEEAEVLRSSVTLSWNSDSSVLAVNLIDRIQLWTVGNYHWYLKQEVRFALNEHGDMTHLGMKWHPEKALDLACYNNTDVRLISCSFAIARGSVTPPNDHGLVAVIDGKRLKITPLRYANVPPPMAFDELELHEPAAEVSFDSTGTTIIVRHGNGEVSEWSCDYSRKPVKKATLLRRNHDSTNSHSSSNTDRLLTGERVMLSENGLLSISGSNNLRIPGCTSYLVTDTHLIFTTSNHLVKFVHVRRDGSLEVPPDEPEKDERCRSIERGAKIVTVMPSTSSLVLQMPRGNLETVYPRALILSAVRACIKNRDYKKAFMTCRTHRVDMNILHDHAPAQFMAHVPLFLKQIRKPEYIDLFLSSLSAEDVAETIYKETLKSEPEQTVLNGDAANSMEMHAFLRAHSKVNNICEAFLHEFRKQTSPSLQNIVTAYVCKSPPDLEAGLALVSDLRTQGTQEEVEAAVEHICFLADVNQLYDTALGLYDLDVALLVAQQSQKDPREYLPYLQSLRDMSPLRQRLAIDNDLKRYLKALSHLYAADAFDELKVYMVKHELYGAAIELYRYDVSKVAELMRLYGDSMSARNRFKEAGIAYEFVHDYASAYQAYRSSSLWQECLAAAALVPVSEEELATLARDLSASLEEAKNFKAAATVHLDYLDDVDSAVRFLCKAFQFPEAIRLVAHRRRSELLRSSIDPGLVEVSASVTEMLAEMRTQLAAQVPRIRDLRQKKAEDPIAFIDGADGGDEDIPDNLSLAPTDASTTGTFMTRYTNRSTGTLATNATRKTSKNRRREERKRARGKKGTVYEEEYLVNSIMRLVERLNSTVEDVQRLVEGLMRRAMRERAVAVETAMQEALEVCKKSLDEVFPSEERKKDEMIEQAVNGEDQSRPWGGQGILWDALNASGHSHERPLLKAMERLCL
ncbi:hypothetical protein BAUCODRAFT_46874, partial [Baudoinia panamericana UAMH 10762]